VADQENVGTVIEDDLLAAFVDEAQANESAILTWADALIAKGSHTAAEALSEGFRQKVPLAGGAIGAAITAALGSMDATADTDLKAEFDAIIAQAKAKSLGKAVS
jgi:hypothetical protein